MSDTFKQLTCCKCGHQWLPRGFGRPKKCPECKNPKWDEPRVRPPLAEQRANAAQRKLEEAKKLLADTGQNFQKLRPSMRVYRLAGTVSASQWRERVENEHEYLGDTDLLDWHPADFVLVVDGDCLTGDGIFSGDVVHVQPDLTPETGDIICARGTDLKGNEFATLKHYFPKGKSGVVELRPSNDAYHVIVARASEMHVEGVIISAVRRNLRRRKGRR